jgi:hypothetical protein
MRNFLTKSIPGLLAITAVAGLGYFVLTPPKPAQAEMTVLGFHSADCKVCSVPLVGHGSEGSRYGNVLSAHDTAATPAK